MTDQDPFDDRLRAYLAERASVDVPENLIASIRQPATARPSAMSRLLTLRLGVLGATAALVAVIALVAQTFLFGGVGPTPLPTAGPAQPVPTASTQVGLPTPTPSFSSDLSAAGFPSEVLGLPVLSVPQAQVLIDGGQYQGRAMAVGGWWSSPAAAMACPEAGYEPPIVGRCALEALSPTDAVAGHRSSDDNSYTWSAPVGSIPARVVPETAGTSQLWKDVDPQSDARELPERVVVIAHAGDVRALQCVIQTIKSCEEELVINAFAWVDGQSMDALGNDAGAWNLSAARARDAIQATLPAGQIAAYGPYSAQDVQLVDPRVPLDIAPVWIGRVITGPPDAAGTAELDEVLVSDATTISQTLPMAFEAGQVPASIRFSGAGVPFDNNGAPSVLVAVSDRSRRLAEEELQTQDNAPAVLAAGDYRIDVWARDQGSDDPTPPIPPNTSCSAPLHVTAGEVDTVTITWTKPGLCAIEPPGPAPTTGPPAPTIMPSPSAAGSIGHSTNAADVVLRLSEQVCSGWSCDQPVGVFALYGDGTLFYRSFDAAGTAGDLLTTRLDEETIQSLLAMAVGNQDLREAPATFTTFGAIPDTTFEIHTDALERTVDYPFDLRGILASPDLVLPGLGVRPGLVQLAKELASFGERASIPGSPLPACLVTPLTTIPKNDVVARNHRIWQRFLTNAWVAPLDALDGGSAYSGFSNLDGPYKALWWAPGADGHPISLSMRRLSDGFTVMSTIPASPTNPQRPDRPSGLGPLPPGCYQFSVAIGGQSGTLIELVGL